MKKSTERLGVTVSSNLNALINVSLYTNLTSLLGRRSNALLNTDISGTFYINTRNLSKPDIHPISIIVPEIILSKYDSQYKSIDSSSIKVGKQGEKDTVDRMLLMLSPWLIAGLKVNVFHCSWRPISILILICMQE